MPPPPGEEAAVWAVEDGIVDDTDGIVDVADLEPLELCRSMSPDWWDKCHSQLNELLDLVEDFSAEFSASLALQRDPSTRGPEDEEEGTNTNAAEHEHGHERVDLIVAKKRANGENLYRVQWASGDVTWESLDALDSEALDLVVAFEQRWKELRRNRPKKPADTMPTNPKRAAAAASANQQRAVAKPRSKRSIQAERRAKNLAAACAALTRGVATVGGGGGFLAPPPGRLSVRVETVPGSEFLQRNRGSYSMEVTTLYHGTRWEYAQAIMRSGFQLPKERSGHGLGPVRPHMFGKGVYLTSSREKASHFGDTLLVCEVVTGRQKVYTVADQTLTADQLHGEGYDSVYAPPGCGGNVFDEYVVFEPARVRIVAYIR